MESHSLVSLETIVSLCKRRGFVYPSADIYGGINGIYDFGKNRAKEEIKQEMIALLKISQEIEQLR